MKKILNLLMLFATINMFSQNFEELKKTGKPSVPTFVYERPQNCALNTSFLMMDLKQNKEIDYLKNRYSLNEIDNILYVGAFLKVDKETFQKNNVESLGVKLNTEAGNFFTALIPINNLESIFSIQGIVSVEIAEKVHSTMDNARTLTNVNQVHAGTGLPQAYSGNGVVVGVIDAGFDYTHPNFRNVNTQQTRISRVWEQNGITTAPAPYGTEYVGSTAILNKMRDKIDASHGTHVTGIASGSGGIVNSPFKGVAYESEIVLVSNSSTIPEFIFGDNTKVLDGINYIFSYSNNINKPSVINLSLGSHIGPHDGSSVFDQMCNNLVGNGRIIVGAAGNEGSDKIHTLKNLSQGNSQFSFISFPNSNLPTKGTEYVDIWGEVGNNFEVAVNIYNVVTNQFESFTQYVNTATNNSLNTTIYDSDTSSSPDPCVIGITTERVNQYNNKPHATVVINNTQQDDLFRFILLEIRSNTGAVNTWLANDKNGIFSNLTEYNLNISGVTDGNTNMTVGEIGGTGNSIISVGAFNSKSCTTMFLNNNNIKCTFDVNTDLFKIAYFSSKGPTVDGRIKPDITAPGNRIVSSISRFDSRYDFQGGTFNQYANYADVVSGLTSGTNTWRFAAMQGTSMSSPMVAGIIALWLQAKPNLTVAQIKTILQSTSITDSDTGSGSAIPNNTWGSGKINALAGMLYINQFLNVDTFDNSNNFVVYPNPTNSKIYITSKDYVGSYEIINTLGQKVSEGIFNSVLDEKELDLSSLQSGLYILNFKGENSNKSIRIIKQ